MATQITITGKTTVGGAATAITLTNMPPIKSILAGELIVNSHTHVFAGTSATPAGTVAAPVFTGAALAAHRHTLHFQTAAAANATTAAAANATTAAANQLRTAAAAFDVAGVADSAGEGGVVDITAGTPAGTNSAPAFTGTAATPAGTNAAGKPARAALTVVTVTPTANGEIQRTGKAALSLFLTAALTADDVIVLSVEEEGVIVRP